MGSVSRLGLSVEFDQGEDALSLRPFLQVIWRRLWVIALVVIIMVVGTTVGFGLAQTPVYEASAEILIVLDRNQGSGNIQTDTQGVQELIGTAVEAVHSRHLAESVVREADLPVTPEALLANLSVEQVADTQFVQIYYRDADPRRAQEIANAIASASSDQVSEVSPNPNAITATVWESAVRPDTPVYPRLIRNGLLALVLGVMLGVGSVLLLEYLDKSWRTPEEVELVSGAPTFGVVPKFEDTKDKSKRMQGKARVSRPANDAELMHVVEREEADHLQDRLKIVRDPASAAAEAYRTLRTNLLYAAKDRSPRVVLLTSPGLGEGKSTTCANLGVALAQVDKSTLLLDCNLRQPDLHNIFGLRNIRGMIDVLAGDQRPSELWEEPLPGLKVLPVGPIPPSPPELFESKRFTEFLEQMRQEFDYVLVDSPPVEGISDALILATQADGFLLVVDDNTSKSLLLRTVHDLAAIDARILGTVMNNVDASGER